MEDSETGIERGIGGAYLRVREVCAELGVGKSFVYDAIAEGRLGAVHLGKRAVRVPRAELVRFLREALAAERVRR